MASFLSTPERTMSFKQLVFCSLMLTSCRFETVTAHKLYIGCVGKGRIPLEMKKRKQQTEGAASRPQTPVASPQKVALFRPCRKTCTKGRRLCLRVKH